MSNVIRLIVLAAVLWALPTWSVLMAAAAYAAGYAANSARFSKTS